MFKLTVHVQCVVVYECGSVTFTHCVCLFTLVLLMLSTAGYSDFLSFLKAFQFNWQHSWQLY